MGHCWQNAQQSFVPAGIVLTLLAGAACGPGRAPTDTGVDAGTKHPSLAVYGTGQVTGMLGGQSLTVADAVMIYPDQYWPGGLACPATGCGFAGLEVVLSSVNGTCQGLGSVETNEVAFLPIDAGTVTYGAVDSPQAGATELVVAMFPSTATPTDLPSAGSYPIGIPDSPSPFAMAWYDQHDASGVLVQGSRVWASSGTVTLTSLEDTADGGISETGTGTFSLTFDGTDVSGSFNTPLCPVNGGVAE